VETVRSNRVTTLAPLMALSAGAIWSFGTVLARVADESDAFQYLIWRSVGIIAIVELWALFTGRPQSTLRAFTSGRRMLAANLALLLASIGFVYAVKTTSAANAAFLGSTTPLFGVVVARLFLGEKILLRTYVAIAIAFVGLVIMVAGDLQVGDFADNIVGDVAALSSAAGFAFYAAIVRSAPERDWSPVLPGYGLLMIVICATVTIADSNTLVPPAPDIGLALVHGAVFIVGGTLIFNIAARSIPAAAMTVFAQTEMVLVPVWAFLLLSERPTTSTLVGGTIIVIAVVGMAVLDARQQPPSEVLTAV
jgi:drug/metabolite transporter (DMT)-like permease